MESELRDFLQSRRARLTPAEVGLPEFGRRRVSGLRREEVAQLAGVSTDYYVRLEQGRSAHVSDQVLDSIARALKLDATETAHLRALARPGKRAAPRTAAGPKPVRSSLQKMLDGMEDPAMIADYTTTVLAANAIARAVFDLGEDLQSADRTRFFFLDPAAREFFADWAADAQTVVAELRVQTARHPDDPRLTALIGELSIKSPDFRALWARQLVRDKTFGPKVLNHPVAGRLQFSYNRMTLADNPDAALFIYTPDDADTVERLSLLASWTMPRPSPSAEDADQPSH